MNTELIIEEITFQHKINIISQLLRKNCWKTPKGFNKYSPEAKNYQEKYEKENKFRLQIKMEEFCYSGLDEVAASKRLENIFNLPKPTCLNIELQKSLRIQQRFVNGIKKDITGIKIPKIQQNFLQILDQEELKLLKIQSQLAIS